MSQREARNSTKSQRAFYLKLKKGTQSTKEKSADPTRQLLDGVRTNMADANPSTTDNNGGDQPTVTAGNDPGHGTRQDDLDTQQDPRPGGSESDTEKQKGERLKNIEDMLLDWKKDKERKRASAERSRRSSRHTQSPSRSRRPSRHTGYSPSSRRSHSRHRSRSRHSSRRRSSRSRSRRRTHSRSRLRRRSSSRRQRHRSGSRERRRSRTGSARDPQPVADSELDSALKLQYPEMGRPKGKPLPKYAVSLEPYRRLPPDLKKNAADRKSRRDLTFPEHMCGFLSMILKYVDEDTEVYGAVEHAAQVAEDAATVGWTDVRSWSQACLGHIEDGAATWTERAAFDRTRTKLSWVKRKSKHEIKVPCHEFNTTRCPEKETHYSEGKIWMHTCSICYYAMDDDDATHTAKRCKSKAGVRAYRDDARRENRWRHNQQSRRGEHKNQPANANTNNKPKN